MTTEDKEFPDVLGICGLEPSEMSKDYLDNKKEFHLHTLITEQRHEQTMELSQWCQTDLDRALSAVIKVDEDITHKFKSFAQDSRIEMMVAGVKGALKSGRKIYVYG